MIESLIVFIEQVVLPFGAPGIFLAEVIEEVIVPIPSALILLGSGFIFLKGSLTWALVQILFLKVVIPATLGLTVGSLVIYGVTYKLENVFIQRFGRFIGVTESDIENMKEKLSKFSYDEVFIVIARIFPLVPSVLLAVFCGLIKMPLKKYFLITLIGAFFRSLLLAIVGWQIGELYIKFAKTIGKVENTFFVFFILALIGFFLYRKSKSP